MVGWGLTHTHSEAHTCQLHWINLILSVLLFLEQNQILTATSVPASSLTRGMEGMKKWRAETYWRIQHYVKQLVLLLG